MRPNVLTVSIATLVGACIVVLAWSVFSVDDAANETVPREQGHDPQRLAAQDEAAAPTTQPEEHADTSSLIDGDLVVVRDAVLSAANEQVQEANRDARWAKKHAILDGMQWFAGPDHLALMDGLDSPDGRKTAYLSHTKGGTVSHHLAIYDRVTGQWTEVWSPAGEDIPNAVIQSFAWTSDGKYIAFGDFYHLEARPEGHEDLAAGRRYRASARRDLQLYNTETGEIHTLAEDFGHSHYGLGSDAAGNIVLAVPTEDGLYINVFDTNGNSETKLIPFTGHMQELVVDGDNGRLWFTLYRNEGDQSIKSVSYLDFAGSTSEPVTVVKDAVLVAVSPLGDKFVYASLQGEQRFEVMYLKTGESLVIGTVSNSAKPVAFTSDGNGLYLLGSPTGFVSAEDVRAGLAREMQGLFELDLALLN